MLKIDMSGRQQLFRVHILLLSTEHKRYFYYRCS
jgi:hypothetical protein